MKQYPHAKRRNFCTELIAYLIVGTIVLACTKSKDEPSREVPPADLSKKDTVYKYQGWQKGDKN